MAPPPRRSGICGPSDHSVRKLFLINLFLLCIVLYAGLTPFHAPRNDVIWDSRTNGLRFGEHATIFSAESFPPGPGIAGHSVEIWMRPGEPADDNTFLAFYDPKQARGFGLHQSVSDLELRVEPWSAWRPSNISRLYVDNAFQDGETHFWAVSSGASGTILYRDGVRIKESRAFTTSALEFSGLLVIGGSPTANNSWSGNLLGLAIYNRALTSEEVRHHAGTWIQKRNPEISLDDACVALYLFNEHAGNVVHNQIHSGPDLLIPAKYTLVNATVLDPVWRAFNWSWGYWQDALINVIGLIPVGFFLCAYLSANGLRNPVLTASVIGCGISLFIELVQVFLPTRDSSMSDLINNTAGSVLGACLYAGRFGQALERRIAHMN